MQLYQSFSQEILRKHKVAKPVNICILNNWWRRIKFWLTFCGFLTQVITSYTLCLTTFSWKSVFLNIKSYSIDHPHPQEWTQVPRKRFLNARTTLLQAVVRYMVSVVICEVAKSKLAHYTLAAKNRICWKAAWGQVVVIWLMLFVLSTALARHRSGSRPSTLHCPH